MDLPLQLDRESKRSLHLQLSTQLRQAILDGLLGAGTRLPSTRSLAQSLSISRNVALAAYDELYAEGYTESVHGAGTFVVQDLPVRQAQRPRPRVENPRWLKPAEDDVLVEAPVVPGTIDFRMGQPSLLPLPRRTWQKLWREMALDDPPNDYGPVAGYDDLRSAVAAYLGRSRGISCSADDVMITSGAIQGFDLVARATLSPGDLVVHEDPGYPVVRSVLHSQGARVVPVPVDSDGLQIERLPTGHNTPLLAYVTPSHQYPTGARLPVSRRLSLIEWANEHDSLVIEDDYDSEFRFDAAPLPAMAGLDRDGRVVYVGTFSKMLTPALRVGYVVANPTLLERIARLKRATDRHCPWPTQRVLARFLDSGRLEAHIVRMRRHYAQKRACLSQAFEPLGNLGSLQGLDAGLHVFLQLRDDLDADRIVTEAAQRGVGVTTIRNYFIATPDRSGILLGYGGLSLEQIGAGVEILVDVIRREAERPATTRPSA